MAPKGTTPLGIVFEITGDNSGALASIKETQKQLNSLSSGSTIAGGVAGGLATDQRYDLKRNKDQVKQLTALFGGYQNSIRTEFAKTFDASPKQAEKSLKKIQGLYQTYFKQIQSLLYLLSPSSYYNKKMANGKTVQMINQPTMDRLASIGAIIPQEVTGIKEIADSKLVYGRVLQAELGKQKALAKLYNDPTIMSIRDKIWGQTTQPSWLETFASKSWAALTKLIGPMYVAYKAIQMLSQAFMFAFDQAVQLELQMARINAMTLVSGKNYSDLYYSVGMLGAQYGYLSTQVLDAVHPLAQLGLSVGEIKEVTKAAMEYSNVTGTDLKENINLIVSVMTNFGVKATEASSVFEKWTILSSKFAVSSSELAKGFEQMGESAQDYGLSIEQLNALMAMLMEKERGRLPGVTRFMRLMAESMYDQSTAANIYKYSGVVTVTTEGARNLYDVLGELSGKWKDLSTYQQNAITSGFKNKSMLEAFRALMRDFTRVQEAYNVQFEHSGILQDQNAMVMNTLAMNAKKLKSVWTDLGAGLLDPWIKLLSIIVQIGVAVGEILKKLPKFSYTLAGAAIGSLFPGGTLVGGGIGGVIDLARGLKNRNNPNGVGPNRSGQKILNDMFSPLGGMTPLSDAFMKDETDKQKVLNAEQAKASDLLVKVTNLDKDYSDALDKVNKGLELKVDLQTRETNAYKIKTGMHVGIMKQADDEVLKRKELTDQLSNEQYHLQELQKLNKQYFTEMGRIKALGPAAKNVEEFDKYNKLYRENTSEIDKSHTKIDTINTELILQKSLMFDILDSYRQMADDTLVEILQKTTTWYDLNCKIRDLLKNIGTDLLKKAIDVITGTIFSEVMKTGNAKGAGAGGGTNALLGLGLTAGLSSIGAMAATRNQTKYHAESIGEGQWIMASTPTDKGGRGVPTSPMGYLGAGAMGAAIGGDRGTAGMAGGAAGSMLGYGISHALMTTAFAAGPWGPVVALGATVAGGFLGSLFGKKKKNEPETPPEKAFTTIPSKIDTTNNQLQIVNRNLIALKEKFEPYPFRSSYYFTARANSGVSSGQWGNVTIHINGAGDPDAVANKVTMALAKQSMQGVQ